MMKKFQKICSYLLVGVLGLACFMVGVKALEIPAANMDLKGEYIQFPDTLEINKENNLIIQQADERVSHYQVLNVTKNTELCSAYENGITGNGSVENFVLALNTEINSGVSGYNENNWLPVGEKIIPTISNVNNGDKILLLVKSASATDTRYAAKIYSIGEGGSSASTTDNTKNPNTGINDVLWVIIPGVLILGTALVVRKNKYE